MLCYWEGFKLSGTARSTVNQPNEHISVFQNVLAWLILLFTVPYDAL